MQLGQDLLINEDVVDETEHRSDFAVDLDIDTSQFITTVKLLVVQQVIQRRQHSLFKFFLLVL